jgi:alcohol dehydrogenase class IV
VRTFDGRFGSQRIVFGSGTLGAVPAELALLGVRRPLVVSTVGQRGLADRVARLAGAAVVFDGAVMHTPLDVTRQAVAALEQAGADGVVSVGGGSTTGLGKAVASRAGVPHLVVPTTYAGSEVTPVLGETSDGEKVTRSSPEILPDAVVYDVDLTTTLPWTVTLTSAVNAMAHAVEALYSADRDEETDAMASQAIGSVAAGLRLLDVERSSLGARADLLHGAWLAGSFGLPHAPTHTVVLPHAMAHNADAAPAAMAAAAAALGVDDAPRGLRELVEQLGGPTDLAALGFTRGDVPRAAELATARPYPNPRPVTREGVTDLLTHAVEGVLP